MRMINRLATVAMAACLAVPAGFAVEPGIPAPPAAPPPAPAPAPRPVPSAVVVPGGAKGLIVKVDVTGDKDRETAKVSSGGHYGATKQVTKEINVTKQLEITLRNGTKENMADLKVTYYVFARDVEFKTLLIVKEATLIATVAPGTETKLQSDPVRLKEKPSSTTRKDNRTVTIPKSGHKYLGYGLRVENAATVVTEIYDPPDLKEGHKTAIPYNTDKKK